MDSEEMASKLLAGVPSVFWHNIPESHLLVARELPGVQGSEELEGCIGGKTKCVKMNETLNQWKAL